MLLAAVLSAWLQYGTDGKPHARAVVSDACPVAVVDGREHRMIERASKTEAFPDVVCDLAVATAAKHVAIGNRPLPAPAHDPRTIAVFGDTGCRISFLVAQACDNPEQWPLPVNARTIASLHPDLIVHVGDYLYREHSCPPLAAACAGSPYGDDAPAWNADWLAPAAPMFAAAPLVLVRGNHESCSRNGVGWFRYLDPHPATSCADATAPYAVDFGDLRIVAFDSAVAEDQKTDPRRQPLYREQFAAARRLASGARSAWFVTHRPPYTNDDERTAMGDDLEPFDAVLAGHLHLFAALDVTGHPPMVINGEGGARLDANFAGLLGLAVGDLHVEGTPFGTSHFGFGLYTRDGSGWTISLRDPNGAERARCTLVNRTVHC